MKRINYSGGEGKSFAVQKIPHLGSSLFLTESGLGQTQRPVCDLLSTELRFRCCKQINDIIQSRHKLSLADARVTQTKYISKPLADITQFFCTSLQMEHLNNGKSVDIIVCI